MQKENQASFFLPNFCDLRMVFAVVLLSELLAFVLTLAAVGPAGRTWDDLALTSLFIHWNSLTGALVLCLLRGRLAALGDRRGGAVAFALLLLVMAFVSEAAFRAADYVAMPLGLPNRLEFALRNLTVGAIIAALALRYLYLQHHWRRQIRAESRARLQALQARIRPHFLFNSMNTIASLIRGRPALAEEAVEDLADLFRASLNNDGGLATVKDELWLARRYLRIEGLRLDARLNVEWNVEGLPEDLRLPPLTLQPLLENAVYHGIEALAEGGTVRILGSREQGAAVITVINPAGPESRRGRSGNRLALENIRQRLAAHFGSDGRLETREEAGCYIVRLRIPLGRGEVG